MTDTNTQIDPLTGEQKLPYRRFDDDGVPFSGNPNAYTINLSDPAQRQNLNTALLTAAQERGALAPMWEVNTAKMQANAGAVNAGLSEEERAAKAGYAAPVDTAYVAAHQADYAGKPVSAHKRVGSFMAVGLGLGICSHKNSKLCPYDSDIGVKKLKDWKMESQADQQPKPARACSGIGRRMNEITQRKKWPCHRNTVIVCSENSSIFVQNNAELSNIKLGMLTSDRGAYV